MWSGQHWAAVLRWTWVRASLSQVVYRTISETHQRSRLGSNRQGELCTGELISVLNKEVLDFKKQSVASSLLMTSGDGLMAMEISRNWLYYHFYFYIQNFARLLRRGTNNRPLWHSGYDQLYAIKNDGSDVLPLVTVAEATVVFPIIETEDSPG